MLNMKEVIKVSKHFRVLYVEDDLSVQKEMQKLLDMFFKDVIIANDGLDGLKLFKKRDDIDLIISDIKMPNMDGLEMAKSIRDVNAEVPIIMITAFSEQSYFLKSIEIKIDKYLLKPIDNKQLIKVIFDISKSIARKKEYEELKAEHQQHLLQEKQKDTISKITDAFISPVIIFDSNELIYYSKPFMKLFSSKVSNLEFVSLDTNLFDKKDGCLGSLVDFDDSNILKNKVYVKQEIGNRIFKVIKKDISLDNKMLDMYIFIDITMEEYQKVKLESYAYSLETMMINAKRKEYKKINSTKKEQECSITTNHLVTSAELIASMDITTLDGLRELDDLDHDLYEALLPFNDYDFSNIVVVSKLLQIYADEICVIEEFENLYISIKTLADLFLNLDIEKLDTSKYEEFVMYTHSIVEDLALWRKSIFIDQQTDNIHYLDHSLFSTVLHIELLFSDETSTDIENDIEFF